MHAFDERASAWDDPGVIVIAARNEDGDPARGELLERAVEIDRSGKERVGIEDIASEDHKTHLLLDGERDELLEGLASRAADALFRGAFVGLEAPERRIDMKIGSVKKFRHRSSRVETQVHLSRWH